MIGVFLTNQGRGIARFPALRYKQILGVELLNGIGKGPIWPISEANLGWTSFPGGANDVIYPGESLWIATLQQLRYSTDGTAPQILHAITIVTETVCDGMPAHRQSFSVDSAE